MHTRNGPRPEAPERPKKQKPNEDWLALSNSISMLGESDLLAIDEDLQDVRWDTAEPSANDFIGRIPSPLTALADSQNLDSSGLGDTLESPLGVRTLARAPAASFGFDKLKDPEWLGKQIAGKKAPVATPATATAAGSKKKRGRELPYPPGGPASQPHLSVALGTSSSPPTMRPPLARPGSRLGRRINFTTASANGQAADGGLPSPSPCTPSPRLGPAPAPGTGPEGSRAASPFGKARSSGSPFFLIKGSSGSLDSLRSINLMVNRVQASSRGRPKSANGRPASAASGRASRAGRSAAPSPAPAAASGSRPGSCVPNGSCVPGPTLSAPPEPEPEPEPTPPKPAAPMPAPPPPRPAGPALAKLFAPKALGEKASGPRPTARPLLKTFGGGLGSMMGGALSAAPAVSAASAGGTTSAGGSTFTVATLGQAGLEKKMLPTSRLGKGAAAGKGKGAVNFSVGLSKRQKASGSKPARSS